MVVVLVAVGPTHLLTYSAVLERVWVSDGLSVELMLDIAAIEFRHDAAFRSRSVSIRTRLILRHSALHKRNDLGHRTASCGA